MIEILNNNEIVFNGIKYKFDKIIFVNYDKGNNDNEGSKEKPMKTITGATKYIIKNGDLNKKYCVLLLEGKHYVYQGIKTINYKEGGSIFTAFTDKDSNMDESPNVFNIWFLGINGRDTKVYIRFGENGEFPGRDDSIFGIRNPNSMVANMTIYNNPRKDHNYNSTLLHWSRGDIRNIYLIREGNNHWHDTYNNSFGESDEYSKFINCVFECNGKPIKKGWSGKPRYVNCLLSEKPDYDRGVMPETIVRKIDKEDISKIPNIGSDLFCSGNPEYKNLDGTIVHVGVFGGEFAWEFYDPNLYLFQCNDNLISPSLNKSKFIGDINDIGLSEEVFNKYGENNLKYIYGEVDEDIKLKPVEIMGDKDLYEIEFNPNEFTKIDEFEVK